LAVISAIAKFNPPEAVKLAAKKKPNNQGDESEQQHRDKSPYPATN
jgi:hypothetical protein